MRQALEMALEALNNSVDLVVEDAYNAEQLYGNYPTRQGKVGGLKVLAEQHKKAITAIKEALTQPETPYEIGQRIAKTGGGISHLWSAVSQDGEIAEAERGFKEALAQAEHTWVGLTWEEIDECFKITPDQYLPAQIYRRIEAKLKDKNK